MEGLTFGGGRGWGGGVGGGRIKICWGESTGGELSKWERGNWQIFGW